MKVNGRENSCENDLWIQCIPNQIPSVLIFFLLKTAIGKLILNYIWLTKIQEQPKPSKTKNKTFQDFHNQIARPTMTLLQLR